MAMKRPHTEAMLDGIQQSLEGSPFVLPTLTYEQLSKAAEATVIELNKHEGAPDWDALMDQALTDLGTLVIHCLVLDVANSHLD